MSENVYFTQSLSSSFLIMSRSTPEALLCPAVHLRPFGNAFHPSRSLPDVVAAFHDCHPTSFCSLSALLPQVVRGLSGFLLPSGVQVSEVMAVLLLSLRRTFPVHLCILIFTDSGSVLFRLYWFCWDLIWPFLVIVIQFVYVCSCDSPNLCPIE